MNIPVARGWGITSQRSHTIRLAVAQQSPSDTAFPRHCTAARNYTQVRLKLIFLVTWQLQHSKGLNFLHASQATISGIELAFPCNRADERFIDVEPNVSVDGYYDLTARKAFLRFVTLKTFKE